MFDQCSMSRMNFREMVCSKYGVGNLFNQFENIEKHSNSKRKFANCFTNENIHHLISGLDPVVHLQPTIPSEGVGAKSC